MDTQGILIYKKIYLILEGNFFLGAPALILDPPLPVSIKMLPIILNLYQGIKNVGRNYFRG